MSTWPIPSNPDATTDIFPTLAESEIDRLRAFGKIRQGRSGDILFEPNTPNIPFFVVLSGEMEIVQPTSEGERSIVVHTPGHFTGELNMISGQRSLVRARISKPGEILEITPDALRSIINSDAKLSEVFMRAFILRRVALVRAGYGNVVVLGSRYSATTLHIREFLGRNGYPYTYMDLDTDKGAQEMLDAFKVTTKCIPVVICNGRTVMRNPSTTALANCLGFNSSVDTKQLRDVVVIGGGPSGLAAAVYGASEGLDTLVIESEAPGGQAGSSSKIENYLGFPTGVSGQELASRALTQAQKFGAKMLIANQVVGVRCDERPYEVLLEDGSRIATRAIVIASGAHYNKPNIPNLKQFEGNGVYYGATFLESQLCGEEEVIVVGGGNSAGQAAVYLSQTARKVHMLVRSGNLSDTMSRYLIQRIEENPRIDLRIRTEIAAMHGENHLESVEWINRESNTVESHDIRHVFIMAGASPRTEWLQGCLEMDDKGFILTGRDLDPVNGNGHLSKWPLRREPYMLETSLPGVFAVGDVRANNVKRVASAVGEGSIAISLVHRVLPEL
ncbi:cyclic nucleotide-regulated FAD-dependent pyridine nucleotide-disulfide oxidoreductase [Candidatus Koribacter versatilis Ellin345]|uniref:Cyclic nucleotide-regulated FAD-dependent pyridine nucleotide-disulfide oxidoreductase n=1 Tax=Koribacter versatilis (strain Ellin345) TaxID=204669 RepID=Q1IQV1_KORVE|nr:FAD-dependent oxidoreductase [Candidatus Koribacter versatilis]ABF40749.1 cyclic nucleotide-regulated FAD-dependent pyridine nucleotide-disulfide oxidoreductase [Candidatus Koribacter versatilis Ellin345]